MNLIIMILLISLLILVHEAGHFIAAKIFNVKVEKFGFGLPFGPTLYSKKIGETEFLIHSFLLGGYVSFPDDEESSKIPKKSKRRFHNKPIYQRAIIVIAGVFSNLLFAMFLIAIAGLIWGDLPSNKYETSVARILPTAVESTKNSGLKAGDIIYSVNGSQFDIPVVLNKYLMQSKAFDGFVAPDLINKKNEELKKLNPQINEKKLIKPGTIVKLAPFQNENPVKLTNDEIVGFEQYKSEEIPLNDLQKEIRDKVYSNKTFKVTKPATLNDIAIATSDTKKPVKLVVLRDNNLFALNNIYPDAAGMIGIEKKVNEITIPTKNLKDLTVNTIKYTNYNIVLMTYGLGKILTGKIPLQEMHGIVAITKIGSDVIEHHGLYKGILLTAIISLNLAIVNLLPIPALDGGHLLFLIIEKVRGKALNEKITETIGNFFFYLLVLLMFLIVFNDIFSLVTKQI